MCVCVYDEGAVRVCRACVSYVCRDAVGWARVERSDGRQWRGGGKGSDRVDQWMVTGGGD